jgi:hypothetical protein
MSEAEQHVQGRLIDLPTKDDERWQRVPNWPRYWVSSLGRVYSEPSTHPGAGGTSGGLMTPHDQGKGYLQIALQRAYKSVKRTVHSLVMQCHGPQPPTPEHEFINHIDGDKTNNRISNLEWVTPPQNRYHGALLEVIDKHGIEEAERLFSHWVDHCTN